MKANTLVDFQKMVSSIKPDKNGCLLWNRRTNSDGYGIFKIKCKQFFTHRLILSIARNGLPKGMCVLHKCDVPRCVNINHLGVGTRADNNKDRMNKGRSALGERSGRSKLTVHAIRKIRQLYTLGIYTLGELGKKFCVSDHQIFQVAHRKSWRHIV